MRLDVPPQRLRQRLVSAINGDHELVKPRVPGRPGALYLRDTGALQDGESSLYLRYVIAHNMPRLAHLALEIKRRH